MYVINFCTGVSYVDIGVPEIKVDSRYLEVLIYFEISELRHIRFAKLKKKEIINKSNNHISKMNM